MLTSEKKSAPKASSGLLACTSAAKAATARENLTVLSTLWPCLSGCLRAGVA